MQHGKESACNVEDLGSIPGLGRSPGGGHGNPLQYSSLENPHGQRSLAGYSPWDRKESDMTEQLSTSCNIKQAWMWASGDPGWLAHRMPRRTGERWSRRRSQCTGHEGHAEFQGCAGLYRFDPRSRAFQTELRLYAYRYTSQRKSPKSHSTPSGHINFIWRFQKGNYYFMLEQTQIHNWVNQTSHMNFEHKTKISKKSWT